MRELSAALFPDDPNPKVASLQHPFL